MANKCINYIFCNGIAYPEIEENTCLMCSTSYLHGEGFGKLEFIETDEDCPICYKKGTQMKFPTNCNHSFCILCCRDLLYFQDGQFDLCPVQMIVHLVVTIHLFFVIHPARTDLVVKKMI